MNKNIVKRITIVLFWFFVESAILFMAAGTVKWLWAWVMVGVYLCLLVVNSFILPREVIEERGRKKENVKRWDRFLTSIAAIPMLAVYVVAGLDFRNRWSGELDIRIHIASLVIFLLSFMLTTWAMRSNRFFSTMVRLQTDRDHTVATEGPYRFVRHPGYVGFIITSITLPLMLGSLYGLIPGAISAMLLVIRTALEDMTLQAELEGYAEYAGKVRYRLFPGLW